MRASPGKLGTRPPTTARQVIDRSPGLSACLALCAGLLAMASDADAQARHLTPPAAHPAHPLSTSPATIREQQRTLSDPRLRDRIQRSPPARATSLPADASPNRWRPERDDPRPGALDYGRPGRDQAAARARQRTGGEPRQ